MLGIMSGCFTCVVWHFWSGLVWFGLGEGRNGDCFGFSNTDTHTDTKR